MGRNNTIGPNNTIQDNDSDGIVISKTPTGTAAIGNQIFNNTIRRNGRYGILIKDASSAQNKISQNSITGNAALGIKLDAGAQGGILPPVMPANQTGAHISGTARPAAFVELYSDPAGQGAQYLGTITADSSGAWGLDLPGQDPKLLTALQTDATGNSSAFSGNRVGITAASYKIATDINGQTTISVTGAGATVTLPEIEKGLKLSNANAAPKYCGSGRLLNNLGDGIWQLNANLFIGVNVTLNLGVASGSTEVKLCSQANANGLVARHLPSKELSGPMLQMRPLQKWRPTI